MLVLSSGKPKTCNDKTVQMRSGTAPAGRSGLVSVLADSDTSIVDGLLSVLTRRRMVDAHKCCHVNLQQVSAH